MFSIASLFERHADGKNACLLRLFTRGSCILASAAASNRSLLLFASDWPFPRSEKSGFEIFVVKGKRPDSSRKFTNASSRQVANDTADKQIEKVKNSIP